MLDVDRRDGSRPGTARSGEFLQVARHARRGNGNTSKAVVQARSRDASA